MKISLHQVYDRDVKKTGEIIKKRQVQYDTENREANERKGKKKEKKRRK